MALVGSQDGSELGGKERNENILEDEAIKERPDKVVRGCFSRGPSSIQEERRARGPAV